MLNEKIRKRTLGVKGMSSAYLRKGKRRPVGLEPRETYKDSRETYKDSEQSQQDSLDVHAAGLRAHKDASQVSVLDTWGDGGTTY